MPKVNNVEYKSPKSTAFFGQKKETVATELKTAAGVMAGAWALKKFPKIAVFGLIGVGIIIGMTVKEVARSVDRFPRRRPEDLH
jgi:hypothetical protein